MTKVAVVLLFVAAPVCLAQADKLDEYCVRIEQFGFSGSVLVAKDGKILLQRGCGYANRKKRIKNTEHTLFEIASATKPFTAAAILKLEQQGKLSTDHSIAKYLPGVPERCRDITIFHLLTHTSGMPRMGAGGGGSDLKAAVAAYLKSDRTRKPGEKYEYWNGGYSLLAGIVEVVTGDSYMAYCHKHLLEPAGLAKTGFTGETQRLAAEPMATGYAGDVAVRTAVGHPYGSYGWQYRGMGGIVTTVPDLYRWDRALRTDKVLDAAARKKHFEPFRSKYACGWYVTETQRKTPMISHGGDVRGFHTKFMRFPEEDACIIVASNVDGVPTWAVAGVLESLLFGETPKFPLPPDTIKLGVAELDAVTGIYELSKDSHLVIRREGDRIRVGAVGQSAVDVLDAKIRIESKPDRYAEHVQLAIEVTKSVADGDVEKVRSVLLDSIPKSWPDVLKSAIWPKHVEKWGKFRRAHSIGASPFGRSRVRVILALEHEKGIARCAIVLHNKKLNIFDLNGPEFAATAGCFPAAKDRFVRFAWVGPSPPPIQFERDNDGNVTALTIKPLLGAAIRCEKSAAAK